MKKTIFGIIAGITIAAGAGIAWANRGSNGTYVLPPSVNPVQPNTPITSAWANTTLYDIGGALTDSLSRTGRGGMQAALQLTNGSASAPSLYWSGSSTTGFYRAGADNVCMSIANNSSSECWSATSQIITNNVGINGNLSAINGTFSDTLNVTGKSTLGLTGIGGRTPGTFQLESADPASTNDGVARIGIADPLMLLGGSGSLSPGLGFNVSTVAGASTYVTNNYAGTFTQEIGTGDLVFKTAPSGTGGTSPVALTERLRVANNGAITTSNGSINTGSGSITTTGTATVGALTVTGGGTTALGATTATSITIGGGTTINASYLGTVSWQPSVVGLGGFAHNSVTVTGAAVGNTCAAGAPASFATKCPDCMLGCSVTASNTCVLEIYNLSTSSSFSAPDTFSCRVFNP